MKHQVIRLCVGQTSFFSQISVSVMVLSREKRFKRVVSTIYTHLYNPPLAVLSYVNPLYLHLSLTLN